MRINIILYYIGIKYCPTLCNTETATCNLQGLPFRVTHGAAPCTLMQFSNDASQCKCTRAVAHRGARCNPVHHHRYVPRCRCTQVEVHRGARCNPVHHHRDAPRCRCTQVVVHRGARCTTVHGGARDHQIVSQNPSSTGLDFRV